MNETYFINFDVPLNKKKCNKKIHCISTDAELESYGFTDRIKKRWYYYRKIMPDITFNLTIDKKTRKATVEVLDENYCQPYDYQHMIYLAIHENRQPNEMAIVVHSKVQEKMKQLMEDGIIAGYNENDYI